MPDISTGVPKNAPPDRVKHHLAGMMGAWEWWRRGKKSFEGIFLPEKTFFLFAMGILLAKKG